MLYLNLILLFYNRITIMHCFVAVFSSDYQWKLYIYLLSLVWFLRARLPWNQQNWNNCLLMTRLIYILESWNYSSMLNAAKWSKAQAQYGRRLVMMKNRNYWISPQISELKTKLPIKIFARVCNQSKNDYKNRNSGFEICFPRYQNKTQIEIFCRLFGRRPFSGWPLIFKLIIALTFNNLKFVHLCILVYTYCLITTFNHLLQIFSISISDMDWAGR